MRFPTFKFGFDECAELVAQADDLQGWTPLTTSGDGRGNVSVFNYGGNFETGPDLQLLIFSNGNTEGTSQGAAFLLDKQVEPIEPARFTFTADNLNGAIGTLQARYETAHKKPAHSHRPRLVTA
jgi:hypothetical protein